MTTLKLLALTLLGCTALGSAGESEEATDVVWRGGDETNALFLSEAALNSAPLEQLPLHESARSTLEAQIASKLNPPTDPLDGTEESSECNLRWNSPPDRPSPGAVTLLCHIARQPVTVVGRVRRLTPGWVSHVRTVVELVEVEVEEVLRDKTAALAPGSTLLFFNWGGKITVHGAELCHGKSAVFATPTLESRFLLVVTPIRDRFVVGMQFPMHGDEILDQPYANVLARENYSLDELRRQLNGEE